MARLPVPGGDADQWAEILNEYLLVSHREDGTQRIDSIPPEAVGLPQLKTLEQPGVDRTNLVLSNDNNDLVWRDAGELVRSASRLKINVVDYGAKGDGQTD